MSQQVDHTTTTQVAAVQHRPMLVVKVHLLVAATQLNAK